ncbi:hypothetical protein [Streptomyces caatingaensis]|uniref:Uncharacterized protein n=1 Tax=Streptomyces caatingaensis TaxID=1678637 RepID=A0A0K9XHN8_9ACTN|nr:hypothetical protein [Streptomyces caatingaensis]KNB52788.1 hypothetical protein AC230_09075 [Streptomyces caatingaensis]
MHIELPTQVEQMALMDACRAVCMMIVPSVYSTLTPLGADPLDFREQCAMPGATATVSSKGARPAFQLAGSVVAAARGRRPRHDDGASRPSTPIGQSWSSI